ncbi:MAG: 1-deoxy-D-xylulose-5-phosphate synthase [Muribaculaceae bacterium]|nr:1-deoxy-D-xylulose-5-phosphate synthase [Muribaculaceae bacterium]
MKQESVQTPNITVRTNGYGLLDSISSPADVRKLRLDQLPELCSDIRRYLIDNLSVNPGHFASSMGAVEIIVALHYVYNTPTDHLFWDVGHQAYAHKILTGRKEAFTTQRKKGGISGFPSPLESEYDTFVTGHASNSISAALGRAIADRNTPGLENNKTVAVIGDASISGGLAFEGLNNVANNPNNLLIILNDNEMSIDANVGGLHSYLSDLSTSARYNKWRAKLYNAFRNKGVVTEKGKGRIQRFANSVKSLVSGKQNIFEGLNIRYFGPFDGHDVIKIVKILTDIKNMQTPRLLHLNTIKGKGYGPAEKNPAKWHAPGLFDPETGEKICNDSSDSPLPWQEVFGRTLVELAAKDDRVMGVTAAMPSGTSISRMLAEYPERTFDVGISEGHAVTFSAGLATGGKRPFTAIYSTFLQRAYDNIVNDVCIQGLPVTLCIDRAGIVGEDGVTHHGLLDIAYLRCIPNLLVAAPADEETLRNLMLTSLNSDGPMAIRYPRGKATTKEWKTEMKVLEIGKGRVYAEEESSDVAILTVGPALHDAVKAKKILEEDGVKTDIYDMIWVKPLDTSLLKKITDSHKLIITVEDGVSTGGFGSAVTEWCRDNNSSVTIKTLGAPDSWVSHGTVSELKHDCGYDSDGIVKTVRSAISVLKQ